MQTRREYLVSKGLAKGERGKFSNEAKAELERAIAAGMTFSDNPAAPAPKVSKPKADKVSTGDESGIAETLFATERRYYGKRWFGIYNGKEVEVTERAACMNCGYSLIGHACRSPKALSKFGPLVLEAR